MKAMREIKTLSDSPTVAINSIARQKMDTGIPIFNLSAGEPELSPHPLIVQAVEDALKQGKTLYPPVSGIPQLRNLASLWMNEHYACRFQSQECLVVNGGKFGIYLLLQLLLQKDDEVIFSSPYWVSYPAMTKLFGGKAVVIETIEEEGWKLTADMLKQVCTKKSKILILNNATNPTGTLYTQSELAALLLVASEQDILVISDEVYSGLVYEDNRFISCGAFKEHQDRVVVIQSCSKNLGMTGWRIGFVFAPTALINPLSSLVSQSTSGVTTISQWAALAALSEFATINNWIRLTMQARRDALLQALKEKFDVELSPPASSLYLFCSLKCLGVNESNSSEFCIQALNTANVALVPGLAFGKEGYFRFSFGAKEQDLKRGIQALADFCKRV